MAIDCMQNLTLQPRTQTRRCTLKQFSPTDSDQYTDTVEQTISPHVFAASLCTLFTLCELLTNASHEDSPRAEEAIENDDWINEAKQPRQKIIDRKEATQTALGNSENSNESCETVAGEITTHSRHDAEKLGRKTPRMEHLEANPFPSEVDKEKPPDFQLGTTLKKVDVCGPGLKRKMFFTRDVDIDSKKYSSESKLSFKGSAYIRSQDERWATTASGIVRHVLSLRLLDGVTMQLLSISPQGGFSVLSVKLKDGSTLNLLTVRSKDKSIILYLLSVMITDGSIALDLLSMEIKVKFTTLHLLSVKLQVGFTMQVLSLQLKYEFTLRLGGTAETCGMPGDSGDISDEPGLKTQNFDQSNDTGENVKEPGGDGQKYDGPSDDGQNSEGPGDNGQNSDGPGDNGQNSDGPGDNGQNSDGPGDNGQNSDGPGDNGQNSDGPGDNGQNPDGPGDNGQNSDEPGDNGQNSDEADDNEENTDEVNDNEGNYDGPCDSGENSDDPGDNVENSDELGATGCRAETTSKPGGSDETVDDPDVPEQPRQSINERYSIQCSEASQSAGDDGHTAETSDESGTIRNSPVAKSGTTEHNPATLAPVAVRAEQAINEGYPIQCSEASQSAGDDGHTAETSGTIRNSPVAKSGTTEHNPATLAPVVVRAEQAINEGYPVQCSEASQNAGDAAHTTQTSGESGTIRNSPLAESGTIRNSPVAESGTTGHNRATLASVAVRPKQAKNGRCPIQRSRDAGKRARSTRRHCNAVQNDPLLDGPHQQLVNFRQTASAFASCEEDVESERKKQLREYERLSQKFLCRGCKRNPFVFVVIPCGHPLCEGCAYNAAFCPVCGSQVQRLVPASFS